MPVQPPANLDTPIHFTVGNLTPVCGNNSEYINTSNHPGDVNCFACRANTKFKAAQRGVETPTPLPQRQMPVLLKDVIADSPELAALAERAAPRPGTRNERGMFIIEEIIHHGEYRSVRRVEVYEINETTVDAVLQSSAYCYGSWKHPENISHRDHRNTALARLVDDLKHGRTNRHIGWSTFRIITD